MSNLLNLKGVKFFAIIVLAVAVLATFGMVAVQQASADCTVMPTVKVGSSGANVQCVQTIVGATADGSFGPMTKAAVMAWQSGHGLMADGVVGPLTAAAMNAPMAGGSYPAGCTSSSGYSTTTGALCSGGSSTVAGCTSTSGYSPTTGAKCDGSTTGGGSTGGALEGGAGSITLTKTSTFGSETVGEGEEEVGVLSFDVEAEDSDVELVTVKVELHQGTAADSEDLTDYLTAVQVFLGDDMVGEADMEDFTENNDVYTRNISLDGAVIQEGDEEEVSVRVTGQNSIDSADRDTAVINVGVSSVRFEDGDGVVTTESSTLDIDDDAVDEALESSFTIGTFATASDTELKITTGEDDDEVNDAHVIDIHATDETTDVPILSFNLEAEGDSDVTIDQLPIRFTVAGNDHVDDVITGISLWMDGDEIGSVAMSTDCVEDGAGCADVGTMETYFFDDMDLTIDAGDDHEFLVKVDIFGDTDTPGDVAPGDTILAEFGEIQTDLTQFDSQDEAGDDLADGDKTGTVAGSASEVRDVGINVALVSATAVKTAGDASATQSDSGLFTITFDVTSFGGDLYIDSTAPDATGGTTESDLTVLPAAGLGGTLLCTMTSSSGATEATSFLVSEDETERFAITCDVRDGGVDLADGFFSVALANLAYAVDDAQSSNLDYTFNLEDFKTPQIFLDDNGS